VLAGAGRRCKGHGRSGAMGRDAALEGLGMIYGSRGRVWRASVLILPDSLSPAEKSPMVPWGLSRRVGRGYLQRLDR
jgi:hypothetical protein